MFKQMITAAVLSLAALPAAAEGIVKYETDLAFEDVTFGLENAIIEAGLVIDHVSHTGEMLERTKGDVGSDVTIFGAADIYSFCSAQLSREVMEADWENVMFCPYDIFVATRPDVDGTVIGYRGFPEGEMQKIQELLDGIVRAAIGE